MKTIPHIIGDTSEKIYERKIVKPDVPDWLKAGLDEYNEEQEYCAFCPIWDRLDTIRLALIGRAVIGLTLHALTITWLAYLTWWS